MRSKPKNKVRYRNLVERDGVIYYRHKQDGRSTRISLETDDWDEAARIRDEWQAASRHTDGRSRLFSEAVHDYLKVAKRHLAACTYDDTHGLLRPGGIVSRHFEDVYVEDIDKAKLAAFWKAAVTDRKRDPKTGRNYLNSISSVLLLCVDAGIIEVNPVSAFRSSSTVRTGSRTKRARQAASARR